MEGGQEGTFEGGGRTFKGKKGEIRQGGGEGKRMGKGKGKGKRGS